MNHKQIFRDIDRDLEACNRLQVEAEAVRQIDPTKANYLLSQIWESYSRINDKLNLACNTSQKRS